MSRSYHCCAFLLIWMVVGATYGVCRNEKSEKCSHHHVTRLGDVTPLFSNRHIHHMRGLYLGWLGRHNLGDDALFEVCQKMMAEAFTERGVVLSLLPYSPVSEGPGGCTRFARHAERFDFVVLGGGSLLGIPEYRCELQAAVENGVPIMVWGTGWDDWTLSLPLPLVRAIRSDTSFEQHTPSNASCREGSSYERRRPSALPVSMDEAYLDRFREICRARWGGVRGAISQRLLHTACASLFPQETFFLPVVGDPGLLVPHVLGMDQEGARQIVHELGMGGEERPLLIVNAGWASALYGSNQDRVTAALAEAIVRLPFDVLVVCVIVRDLEYASALVNRVETLRSSDEKNPPFRVAALPYVPDTPSFLGLLRLAKGSVNFKLHASIFSCAAEVPFVSLAYRLKVFEFADSSEIGSRFALSTENLSAESLIRAVLDVTSPSQVSSFVSACQLLKDRVHHAFNCALGQLVDRVMLVSDGERYLFD